jgi:hypothetical protein
VIFCETPWVVASDRYTVPLNVPVTGEEPLKTPVELSRLMPIQGAAIKPQKNGCMPPELWSAYEYGLLTQAAGNVGELTILTGSPT